MKALTITRSPSVSRPSMTPSVARHSIATSAAAMISCWPVFSMVSVLWLFSEARRSWRVPAEITQTVTPKAARVIRAADFSSKSYLETEAEVDDYLSKLKAELLAAIRAGQRARIQ